MALFILFWGALQFLTFYVNWGVRFVFEAMGNEAKYLICIFFSKTERWIPE